MQDPSQSYTRTWSQKNAEFLTLRSGSKLRYLRDGQGPPLLLLHTVRTQLDIFQRVFPLLVKNFAVYALDYPGFGWWTSFQVTTIRSLRCETSSSNSSMP